MYVIEVPTPEKMRGALVCFHSFVTNFSLHFYLTGYPRSISTSIIQILQINRLHRGNLKSHPPIFTPTFMISLYQTYPLFNIILQVPPPFLHSSKILHLLISLVPSKNLFLLVITLQQ